MGILLERLTPAIDAEHGSIRDGNWDGLCAIINKARKARVITADEHSAVRAAIGAWVGERGCTGYVVFFLSQEFDDMTGGEGYFEFPNETSEGAAQLWKEWAISIVESAANNLE